MEYFYFCKKLILSKTYKTSSFLTKTLLLFWQLYKKYYKNNEIFLMPNLNQMYRNKSLVTNI